MLVVVDAAAASDNSVGVVVSGWLNAWSSLAEGTSDELHVVARTSFAASAGLGELPNVVLHPFESGVRARVAAQHVTVPKLVRELKADLLFGSVPQIPIQPVSVPVVVTSYDLRHEIRPEEFSRQRRAARWVEYSRAYRRADRIVTISGRTRDDLVRLHPQWGAKATPVLLGCDHIRVGTSAGMTDGPALAYAHHTNKRPDLVVKAWLAAAERGIELPPLRIVGASSETADRLHAIAAAGRLPEGQLSVEGFVPQEKYDEMLANVRLIVLASTFEGFGLPVLEGLRLGRPVVVTPDPAMIEVGGDAVTVATEDTPIAIAEAVAAAVAGDSPQRRAQGLDRANEFTWARSAAELRREFEPVVLTHPKA